MKYSQQKIFKHRNKLLLFALLLITVFATRDFAAGVITKYWIDPIMSKMNNYAWAYSIATALVLGVYYYLSYQTERYRSKTRLNILIMIATVTFASFIYSYCEIGKGWTFSSWILLVFAIPIAGELLIYIRAEKLKNIKEENPSLIFEKPIDKTDDDSYNRKSYSKVIAEKINNNFHKDGAFVIGLSGSWGYGKTSFLNLIEMNIDNKIVDVRFDFKPWLSSSTDSIVPDFLAQLAEKLSQFVPNLKKRLYKYAEAVSDINSDPIIKSSLNFIRTSLSDSPEKQYDEINKILKASKLKVLVFIDDTDRLSSNEILEVFKLVRNSANFPYMQFVITYDREYVLDSLKKESSSWNITNPNKYLEKIFNTELSMPSLKYSAINKKLIETLTDSLNIDPEHKEAIVSFLNSYNDNFPVNQIIKTNRDVIRFSNALNVNLDALVISQKNCSLHDIEIVDFVKIEMIRYKFPNYYNTLLSTPLSQLELSKGSKEYFIYKKDNEKELQITDKDFNLSSAVHKGMDDLLPEKEQHFEERIYEYVEEDNLLDVCMINLFSESTVRSKSSISNIRSFDQYFRYSYDERNISQSEIILLLNETDKIKQKETLEHYHSISKKDGEIYNAFKLITSQLSADSWKQENGSSPIYYKKILDLIEVTLESPNDELKEEAIRASSKLFFLAKYPDINFCLEVLQLWDKAMEFDLLIDESILKRVIYVDALNSTLIKETNDTAIKIEHFLRNAQSIEQMSELLRTFTHPHHKVDKKLILELEVLEDIQLSYFMKYAEKGKIDDTIYYLFESSSMLQPETGKYKYPEKAIKKLRKVIDKDPQSYLNKLIDVQYNKIYLDPWWPTVFNNEKAIESYLSDSRKNELKGITEARIVWDLYKYNEYKDIDILKPHLKSFNQKEIIPILHNELKIALDIKKQLSNLESLSLSELEDFYTKLNQSPLNIVLVETLRKDIGAIINYLPY